jgi:hypothetical protein
MEAFESSTARRKEESRRPYEKPALRIFGSVTAITSQFTRDMGAMDGGPNNLKT